MKKIDLDGDVAAIVPPPAISAAPRPPLSPAPAGKRSNRGSDKIKVAKIDVFCRRKAIIQIKADMKEVRKVVGARRVGMQHLTTLENGIQIHVVCAQVLEVGPIWRLKDGLPVRGNALLVGNAGAGASDFPADAEWLEEFIIFPEVGQLAPEGIERAINDPVAQR